MILPMKKKYYKSMYTLIKEFHFDLQYSFEEFIQMMSAMKNNYSYIICDPKIVGYIGFDPTSDSLHIGSLVQLMLLYWMQYYGHKPIALMGGGTTLVGDPSGKDESRKILIKKEIEKNINKIKLTFKHFIDFSK